MTSAQRAVQRALELHALQDWLQEWVADRNAWDVLTRADLRKLRRMCELIRATREDPPQGS